LDLWIFTTGKCDKKKKFINKYEDALEKFLNKEIVEDLETKFNNWMNTSKTFFINMIRTKGRILNIKII
jgi:hypothetical protein